MPVAMAALLYRAAAAAAVVAQAARTELAARAGPIRLLLRAAQEAAAVAAERMALPQPTVMVQTVVITVPVREVAPGGRFQTALVHPARQAVVAAAVLLSLLAALELPEAVGLAVMERSGDPHTVQVGAAARADPQL
jgi:hypothetical protein